MLQLPNSMRREPAVALVALLSLATAARAGDDATLDTAAAERLGIERGAAADETPAVSAVESARLGVVVRAELVARQGDVPPGEVDPISNVNAPFTNALGEVGFTGNLVGPDGFVWFDEAIVWHNSDETGAVLVGGEPTMGISDTGGFVYSPSVDGNDAVWTHNGALLVEGDAAPGYPPPAASVFNSRPHMSATGQAYWVGGVSESGGTTTEVRALFTSPTATAGDVQVVLRSGDIVGGFTIASGSSGIDFDFDVSSDDTHRIQALVMDTGSTADNDFVYVDGELVAREGSPTGDGDNWGAFDAMAIAADGHYLFSGDTDGAIGTDEFVAHDGTIVVREGDSLGGGVTLATPAAVNALSLADDGQIAHLWTTAGGLELLFHACSAAFLPVSTAVLRTGDQVDLDGDGVADATVTDFNASGAVGPGLDLAGDGRVLVEVDLDAGAGALEAVVAFELPLCMPFLDGFESGDTSRWTLAVP